MGYIGLLGLSGRAGGVRRDIVSRKWGDEYCLVWSSAGSMCLRGSFSFSKPGFSSFHEVLRQVFKLSCLNESHSFKKTGPWLWYSWTLKDLNLKGAQKALAGERSFHKCFLENVVDGLHSLVTTIVTWSHAECNNISIKFAALTWCSYIINPYYLYKSIFPKHWEVKLSLYIFIFNKQLLLLC